MENDALICAKFIFEIYKEGYYVNDDVLDSAKNILAEYIRENGYDCDDYDESDYGNINY